MRFLLLYCFCAITCLTKAQIPELDKNSKVLYIGKEEKDWDITLVYDRMPLGQVCVVVITTEPLRQTALKDYDYYLLKQDQDKFVKTESTEFTVKADRSVTLKLHIAANLSQVKTISLQTQLKIGETILPNQLLITLKPESSKITEEANVTLEKTPLKIISAIKFINVPVHSVKIDEKRDDQQPNPKNDKSKSNFVQVKSVTVDETTNSFTLITMDGSIYQADNILLEQFYKDSSKFFLNGEKDGDFIFVRDVLAYPVKDVQEGNKKITLTPEKSSATISLKTSNN